MQLEYREIQTIDIVEVAKLHNELAYHVQKETNDAYWDFDVLSEEDVSKHLATFIDLPDRKIYIARNNEKIAGFIAGEIMQCHLPISNVKKIGYISGAYVLPEYRGRGIMRFLEVLVIDYFKQYGIKYVELNFVSKNKIAKNNWENLGYRTFREQARKEI